MTQRSRSIAGEVDGITRAAWAWASTTTPGRLRISRALPLVLGLLGLQTTLFVAFATHRLEMGTFAILHLALCAATATLGRWWLGARRGIADDTSAVVLQLAAWTALAGPLGTAVAGALLVPLRAEVSHAEADHPEVGGGRPELTRLELLHGSLLDSRLRLERAHVIRPLLDVIIEGSQLEKFDALSLISKRYDPALAPALRRAMEDKDGSVRVLTATVMAQQHNACTKRIGGLQATARAAPDISGHWRDLGQAQFDYAKCGLLEPSRAGAEVSSALEHLGRAAELDPGDAVTGAQLDAVRRFAALDSPPAVAAHDHPDGNKDRVKSIGL